MRRNWPMSWSGLFSTWRSTRRYGVSMKPYSLMRPYVASEPIRPMFGPSGVSIGQMRP
jgi:hypothetical protein